MIYDQCYKIKRSSKSQNMTCLPRLTPYAVVYMAGSVPWISSLLIALERRIIWHNFTSCENNAFWIPNQPSGRYALCYFSMVLIQTLRPLPVTQCFLCFCFLQFMHMANILNLFVAVFFVLPSSEYLSLVTWYQRSVWSFIVVSVLPTTPFYHTL
jgi:hypothetical protein